MTKKEEKKLEEEVRKWLRNLLAKERKRLVEEIEEIIMEIDRETKTVDDANCFALKFIKRLTKLKGSRDSTKEGR